MELVDEGLLNRFGVVRAFECCQIWMCGLKSRGFIESLSLK